MFGRKLTESNTLAWNCAVETPLGEPLTLRDYQKELIKDATQEKNCLIIAPTGSGKTPIAIAVAQARMPPF